MRTCRIAVLFVCSVGATACGGDDGASGDASTGTEGTEDTGGVDGSTSGVAGDGGEVLGCPAGQTCDLLLVSQTLDDRVEVFSPDDPGGVIYRGAIDLDLEPNACEGCEPGDYGDDRLDEPYELTIAGGHLHVLVGHYPERLSGSLVSFPYDFFAGRSAGVTIDVAEFFADGTFTGALETPLSQTEPIWTIARGGKLLVSAFGNDLFATEDTWTTPGRLLVLDAADPSAGTGVLELGALEGGPCAGAGQITAIDDTHVAIACDGSETVAILDHGDLSGAPADAAAAIGGRTCTIPGAQPGRRVRHLAPDGSGGVIVLDGPGTDLLADARMWWFDGACAMLGFATLDGSDWQLGQIRALPSAPATWVFGRGAATTSASPGIYVARGSGGSLEVCGPVPGFDGVLTDAQGDPLQPEALAVSADGTHLAVGTGPFAAPMAGPGYGKVGWATLSGVDDPCTMTASVVDLTTGAPLAPAVDAADPATYRRAPSVVELVRVTG